jgi:hypothetical protein
MYIEKVLGANLCNPIFSFDVTVGTQYEKETAVVVPLSQLDIATFSAVGAAD